MAWPTTTKVCGRCFDGEVQGAMREGAMRANNMDSSPLEKEMATHSSVLAWRIPGTGEPSGLPSMGSRGQTGLKQLSSSSTSPRLHEMIPKR